MAMAFNPAEEHDKHLFGLIMGDFAGVPDTLTAGVERGV